jgi:diguanylate cyclase (GGDEF)-like protein/PAS domain S-box-containing protein
MSQRIRAFAQTTTYLGIAVISIIWGGIYLLDRQERARDYEDAVRQGSNLTRLLDQYITRVVEESDNALIALRQSYQENPKQFDMVSWLRRTRPAAKLALNYGIADADGFVIQSSRGPVPTPLYVGDREHFKFHVTNKTDQLYISAPIVGRVSGHPTIEISRRLNNADGSFAGTAATSLNLDELEGFLGSLDIGQKGVVSLSGFDGIVRARGGRDQGARRLTGVTVSDSPMFQHLREKSEGSYWNTAASSAKFDGVRRLLSYRAISTLPLIAIVGLSRDGIFEKTNNKLQAYIIAGAILSAIVLIVAFLAASHKARISAATDDLKRSKDSIERANHLLNTALEHMPHGLCMFDREQRLVVANDRYAEMYGISPDKIKPGTTLREILEERVKSGTSPEDTEQYILNRLDEVASGVAHYKEDQLRDGRAYAVNHQPMAGGGWVAIHQDITEHKVIERALTESTAAYKVANARFSAALQNMSQGLCMVDAAQKILVANERYRQIYELPEHLIQPGTPLQQIMEFRAKSGNYEASAASGAAAAPLDKRTDIERLGNGRVILILRHAMADGGWLTTHEDITERWRNETRVSYLAHHDALTGLANRSALVEKIEDACARCRRWGEQFNILLIDLDRFKHVNDTFGHPAGDELLIQVAERLKGTLRETDVLARLGGDEFAIVQSNHTAQIDAADILATRIVALLAEPLTIDGNVVSIGASIGVALAPSHGTRAEDLLKMADLALYQAKDLGRNRYAIFEPALGQAAVDKHRLDSELRRALEHNEFEVYFQPIVDTGSLELRSVEALVRWHHPTRGLITPDEFIPFAEETGLILHIGEWVLQAACQQAVKWPASVKVAVNLSAVQLHSANLLDFVVCALVESGLPPERLELEVTETALIEYEAESLLFLRKLKNLGVTVVLDDFGTGYSSLSQLTMFPFDKIKIEKSFTRNMTTRADCAAIITAVLALAHSLDIQTTAEGVETMDQLRILRAAGVSTVQGYLIQHPCPAGELKLGSFLDTKVDEHAA